MFMRNPKLSVRPYFFLYYHNNYYLAFKLPLPACCMRRPGCGRGTFCANVVVGRPIRIDDAPTPPGYSLLLC